MISQALICTGSLTSPSKTVLFYMTREVSAYLKCPSFPRAVREFTTWIWNEAFHSSPFSALLALWMGKSMLSIKAILLVAPAWAFVEIVRRGKEIGKVRLESIITFKNYFRICIGHTHTKRKTSSQALSTLYKKFFSCHFSSVCVF